MFEKFIKNGPAVKPVSSQSCWRDTRPAKNSVTHGTYQPVLDVRAPKTPEHGMCMLPPEPKKPRGTI
jgi:hypothetical protein